MAEYARVENGVIVERREIESIPPHKAHLWTPVVYEGGGDLSDIVIEENRVLVVRSEVPLDQIKSALLTQVDDDAERERLRYITSGSGKAMSYQEKLAEARLVLDDPMNVSPDLVPILAAEAEARGISLEAAAALVHTTYLAFKSIEAQINATSVLAKAAISSASDAASAKAAYEAVQWPTTP